MSTWTNWLKNFARTPRTRRASRRTAAARTMRRPWALLRLEDRLVPTATVWTDKPDYAPGSTATFKAFNDSNPGGDFQFSPAEVIKFQVTRRDGQPDYPLGNIPWGSQDNYAGAPFQVTDAAGTFWVRADLDPTPG